MHCEYALAITVALLSCQRFSWVFLLVVETSITISHYDACILDSLTLRKFNQYFYRRHLRSCITSAVYDIQNNKLARESIF